MERPAQWVRAWKPEVPGIHEVFHARFVHHAYPAHTHDAWTVFTVDEGSIAYDLERRHRGVERSMVTLLPPGVVHDGRPATSTGYRKRVLYVGTEVLGEQLIGAAVDQPDVVDPSLVRGFRSLHRALGHPEDVFEAESVFAIVAARLARHLGDPALRDEGPLGTTVAEDLRDLLDARLVVGITLDEAGRILGVSIHRRTSPGRSRAGSGSRRTATSSGAGSTWREHGSSRGSHWRRSPPTSASTPKRTSPDTSSATSASPLPGTESDGAQPAVHALLGLDGSLIHGRLLHKGSAVPLSNSEWRRRATSARAGHYVRQPGGYRAFVPAALPPPDLVIDARLQALLSTADLALGRLDGATKLLPDPDFFVLMYVRREAVVSSQIEGTHASLMDVLEYEAEMDQAEPRVDVVEIANYVAAMNHGLARLPELPISRRLLCEVHAILMKDVRGGEPQKTPGEFRTSQNWIGGASPATARFVPPPWEEVSPTFADLERFLHDDEPMPALIKAGLAHAQFESIHPFLDGNGRIGRLLISFWLVDRKIIERPILYPSLFFKEHRDDYIDRLQAIRDDGAWEDWLAFFVDGLGQVAEEATGRALQIVHLREAHQRLISERLGKRAPNALALLQELFRLPVVSAKLVESMVAVSQPTASALVRDLEDVGILRERTGKRRNRLFAYQPYLDLFPGASARS